MAGRLIAVTVIGGLLLAIGCIQTQRCHTGRCPTGVTTHNRRLTRGLDPALKSVRCANYIMSLRAELLQLAHACGQPHPALVPHTALELLYEEPARRVDLCRHFRYPPDLRSLSAEQASAIAQLCARPAAERDVPVAIG
jgi:hypothetical protein